MDFTKLARQIIGNIKYITIATASADGVPWNTPVYSAFDSDYNFYWASDQESQHSRNIAANPQVLLAIYDSTVPEGTGRGVYVQARATRLETDADIQHGNEQECQCNPIESGERPPLPPQHQPE